LRAESAPVVVLVDLGVVVGMKAFKMDK